ncbi:alpha/beta hydrolase [Mesorhizobium sp. WSM3859]|uniref:alpha/beta hydrolase n=1 Tax=Mesorhizobium sp. WSM3859 TaxID=2029402 RepID=UPI000BB0A882|nr:alpha/beta hydrolase [Mesorhizobium sp. WSM3859]PBC09045.1 phospholipase [Mesorhizobium sp. WSM3859]
MSLRFLFALLVATGLTVQAAHSQTLSLKPFKDDLFAYPAALSTGDNGAYTVLDYHEMRDINQRDEVPEKRVRAQYTDPGVRKVQQDLMLKTDAGDIRHVAVGRTEGASIIVLYLHGQGGSRKQGVDDFTFGGNFNRIKNLMAANNGLYLSPDFPDFGDKGAAQVAALIDHYAQTSPGAKIFVACGSMGGMICWKLAARNDTGRRINGLLLLGSLWDESFFSSPAFRRHVPVFFGQGSHDVVFPVEKQEAFFRSVIAKSKAYPYPTRFVRFETGTHGTPIRMVDWRGTLNWMLTKAP